MAALLGLGMTWPQAASAYDEQVSLDLAIGGVRTSEGAPASGGLLGLGATVGLGDLFMLRAGAGAGLDLGTGRSPFGHAQLEVLYAIDVLEWVPFMGLGGGGLLDGERAAPLGFGIIGVDYLASRRYLAGVDVRAGVLSDGGAEAFGRLDVRVGWLFDVR